MKSNVNPKLEKAVARLLADMDGLALDDKLKVIDRAMRLEIVKLKAKDEAYGSELFEDPDEEPNR